MNEIRIHGRGGQGAVTAANLLVAAALEDGNVGVQAFPFFGAERRGAPVRAFARISDEEIHLRSEIYNPDIVIVLDESIMDIVNVLKGLKKDEDLIDLLELLIEDYDNKTISEIGNHTDMEPVELLKSLMSEHNLTKSELARKVGVSRQLITEIVNYKRNISKRMVMKLADFFKMMPAFIS